MIFRATPVKPERTVTDIHYCVTCSISQLGTRGTLILAAEEDDEFEVFAIQGEHMRRSTQRGHAISERLLRCISASPRYWDADLTHLGEQIWGETIRGRIIGMALTLRKSLACS